MSRAERFEDEKRRMIESCFAKLDETGQLTESYITHIRITEDAAHPSSPPPPTSAPTNKKARIVVISVRSSGRVRMHKARENSNATFSIGKTWNLEDLSAIESYNHFDPNAPPQQEQIRQWAGPVGFLVTIVKPYYWQAGTAKEKDFFIASLVKIYRKYTKGQVPELKGFSDSETETLLGMAPGQLPPRRPQPDPRSGPAPPRPPFAEQGRTGSNDSRQRAMSKDRHRQPPDGMNPALRNQMSQDPAARQRFPPDGPNQHGPNQHGPNQHGPNQHGPNQHGPNQHGPNQHGPQEHGPRQPRHYAPREQGLRQPPSREQLRAPPSRDVMRPPPDNNQFSPARPPQPFASRLTPKSSQSELRTQPSGSPANSNFSSVSRATTPLAQQQPPALMHQPQQNASPLQTVDRQPSSQSVQSSNSGLQQPAIDGASLFNATVDRWKPQSAPQIDIAPQRQRPYQSEEQPRPLQLRDQASSDESGRNFSYEVQPPPERKRPLMSAHDYSAAQKPADSNGSDMRPPPLSSSRTPSANARPQSPLSQEVQQPERMPGAFYETPNGSTSTLPMSQPAEESMAPSMTEPAQAPVTEQAAPPQAKAEGPPSIASLDTSDAAGTDNESDDTHRPGLGPMIKKKGTKGEVAKSFLRAATAYNAFKPRAGGAGERLAKDNVPDGMNAVVPAPLRKMSVDPDRVESPVSPVKTTHLIPEVPVTLPSVTTASSIPSPAPEEKTQEEATSVQLNDEPVAKAPSPQPEPDVQLAQAPEPRRPKRRAAHQENYLRSLDIDPRLLDGRGLEFETILTDFGWGANTFKGRQLEDLEADLKRELGRIEAGSWLGHLEQKDDRVDMVDQMLDRAIAECDELEGLLTLYAVELGSLNDDIAFIEAQSQGLQVQTANQKILHTELQKLVDTISITKHQLQPLRYGDLSTLQGLSEIESSLLVLYKAMVTIDPSMRSKTAISSMDPTRSSRGSDGTDVATMHALREKRQAYLQETAGFCQRLLRHLDSVFEATLSKAKPALLKSSNGIGANMMKLNSPAYSSARDNLWQFSPLLLFTKDVNQPAWHTLIRTYYSKARPLYTEVFRENTQAWKKSARTAAGEAADILFTSVEKESPEALASTSRRITVKRSQTLAKTFRTASGEKTATLDTTRQAGRLTPCEVFAGVMEEQMPVLSMEQNFVVTLFHVTSLQNIDFADAVMAAVPAARTGQDLSTRRLMEPDRNVARQVSDVMEELFGFWSTEMKSLMEWAISDDPIQGVGILTSLAVQAAQLQETSQEYALHNLTTLSQRLTTLFQKFVDEQIRAIELIKVKPGKRKGVYAFMKTFPHFSAAVENVYQGAAGRADGTPAVSGARQMIDEAYVRINKTMWDCLKFIASESHSMNIPGQAPDPEKELLNHKINMVENMHHYIEEVDDGGVEGSVLAQWRARALMDRAEALEEYVSKVIQRPLGKILAFVESSETMLAQNMSGPSIAKSAHTRHNTKEMLKKHDPKTIRSGIETLRARVEKHFRVPDEDLASRQLAALACKECLRRYEQILDRLQSVCKVLYKDEEKQVEILYTKEDIRAAFK